MEITVREAMVEDAVAIAAINLDSWEAAYRGIVADAILDHRDLDRVSGHWRDMLLAGANPILVADLEGVLAGYCSLILPARDADLDDLTGEMRLRRPL